MENNYCLKFTLTTVKNAFDKGLCKGCKKVSCSGYNVAKTTDKRNKVTLLLSEETIAYYNNIAFNKKITLEQLLIETLTNKTKSSETIEEEDNNLKKYKPTNDLIDFLNEKI